MSYRHATDILDYMPSKVGFDPGELISAAAALRAGDLAYGIEKEGTIGSTAFLADAMSKAGDMYGSAQAAQAADQAFGQVTNSLLSSAGSLGVDYAMDNNIGLFKKPPTPVPPTPGVL